MKPMILNIVISSIIGLNVAAGYIVASVKTENKKHVVFCNHDK